MRLCVVADGRLFPDAVHARINANRPLLEQLRSIVTKHLEKNGRRWVSMQSLFSFMKV